MGRNKSLDHKDGLDDIDNWVHIRKIRVNSQVYNQKIAKMNNMYYTNYLII